MSADLFADEQAILEAGEALLADAVDWPEDARAGYQDLLKSYKRAFRQSKRLVRMSDRTQEEIRAAHATLDNQQTELQALYDERGRHAEVLEHRVQERTIEVMEAQLQLEKLVEMGIGLSAERDQDRLLEGILLGAKQLTNADGGTLYLRTEDDTLAFEIVRNDSLDVALGGTTGKSISFPDVLLYDVETGIPNHKNIASHVALNAKPVNIPDAYETEEFDFSGTREFDKRAGYRSTSFLAVPLINRKGAVLGVLQLINASDPDSGEVVGFSDTLEGFVAALGSQAAVALENQRLLEEQRQLLDSFIELIAGAIDSKSPYTGGHCERVPELAKMLAEAACESEHQPFLGFQMGEDEWYEFHLASWLHDCGKVTSPEYVVDKATKLETIYNRLHEIRTRFEVLIRDAEVDYLKAMLAGDGDPGALTTARDTRIEQLKDDFAFIAESNVGGEFMDAEAKDRVIRIAAETWTRHLDDRLGLSYDEAKRANRTPKPMLPVEEYLLADKEEHIVERAGGGEPFGDNPLGFRIDVPEHLYNYGEVYNLCIERGTLTAEERFKINDHIIQTILMLSQLPFPKHLERIPEFAGGHHETLIGTGYPKKLSKDDMSLQARIMAIADIFEALTASDRPYKKAKTLSEALKIMSFMRDDQHIDPELFQLFLENDLHRQYADRFLMPEQVDDVTIADYLPAGA